MILPLECDTPIFRPLAAILRQAEGIVTFSARTHPIHEPIQGEETMNEPIHVNDNAFEQAVLKSPIPVLVDFWAPWCGPCRMVAPSLETLAKEFAGRMLVAKVNTDENPEWAVHYGVRGIPTMLIFHNGQIVYEQAGALPLANLRQLARQFASASVSVPQKAA
jgi:thioredoxin 1